jgi:hypothetical protein
VIFNSAPEPIGFLAPSIADQTFVTGETADRIDQTYGVIQGSVGSKAISISGALVFVGPIFVGPAGAHRLDRISFFQQLDSIHTK